MKKILAGLILLNFVLPTVDTYAGDGEAYVRETNIDNLRIMPSEDAYDDKGYIKYGDGGEESIERGYTALFINGSIVKDFKIVMENGKITFPLRLISEALGAEVKWIPNTRETEISDGENTIKVGEGNVKVLSGKNELILDIPPKIIDGLIYVPEKFITEALGAEIVYSINEESKEKDIIRRLPRIMISRYDEDVKPISREKAVDIVREKLITAYENRYGEYIPINAGNAWERDGDDIREAILNLRVSAEDDRYYVIPVVFDFWVDKYTGAVYVYYNGLEMNIYLFDPNEPGALAFAG